MAAMLNWINQNLDKHIVTIEDPIEYTFSDDKCLFQQREIGLDVPSFELAIKSVLRQNPDIILIGEMRDKETFETAISAAETGHLVFSTMHAATVKQSLTRLFEFFPPEQHEQARRQIAGSLRGFICQKLIPALEGGGRFAAHEILIADTTVSNLILECILPNLGRHEEAERCFERARRLCTEHGDGLHMTAALNNRYWISVARLDGAQAVRDQLEALRLGRELGGLAALRREYFGEYNIAECLYMQGDGAGALPHAVRALLDLPAE